MKFHIFFLLAFFEIILGFESNDLDVNAEWQLYQKKYDKAYRSVVEYKRRMSIFEQNVREYKQHNELYEKGQVSYKKGVNKFTDWTKDEFMGYVKKGFVERRIRRRRSLPETVKNLTLPSHVNWVQKGAVTEVKDQGFCGSCYAFSTIGSLESNYKIKYGKLIPFSEQQLIDCSWDQGNYGCEGGLASYSLDYVKQFGIESATTYPYREAESTCHYNKSNTVTKIRGYVEIEEGSEEELQAALANVGPVSVAIDATFELQGYDYGILDDHFCTTYELNHYVVVVGYGVENGVEYYLVKNSWGKDWGDHGYFKIVRNRRNRCGIATMAVYPVM